MVRNKARADAEALTGDDKDDTKGAITDLGAEGAITDL